MITVALGIGTAGEVLVVTCHLNVAAKTPGAEMTKTMTIKPKNAKQIEGAVKR
jgi:hypothetical protein